MKYILQLALKNILRSKRRTILTFMMLTFGVTVYMIMSSLYAGIDEVSFDNLVQFETGHVKMRHVNFDEDRPFSTDNLMTQKKEIYEKIKKHNFVKGVTDRINLLAEMDNGIDSMPVVIVGYDQSTDKDVFELAKFISKGKMEKDGAIIGVDLAKDMGLDIGDIANLTFRDVNGMYTALDIPVTALLYSGDPMANKMKIFMNIEIVQKNMDTDAFSEIAVKTDNMYNANKYAEILQKEISEADVKSWKTLSYEFANVVSTKKKAGNFILFVILIIAMVGIINTILISIYEKRREIGTLKAMGMLDKEVRNLFVAEGFIIGFTGSLFGLVFGTIANLYFIYHGLDFTSMMDQMGNMGASMVGVMKSVWVIKDYFVITFLATAASIFASYYPAKKVMDMQPVDCLRTVQ
ncbi:MAG: FtsX-like permease family protein [Spirochaetia bacterium]|nr:FtsX-like permease family protein [Spirochaetia bacterium]